MASSMFSYGYLSLLHTFAVGTNPRSGIEELIHGLLFSVSDKTGVAGVPKTARASDKLSTTIQCRGVRCLARQVHMAKKPSESSAYIGFSLQRQLSCPVCDMGTKSNRRSISRRGCLIEIARLHLERNGVKLTKLTKEQTVCLGMPIEGRYKPEHYRY